jgi:hypothetical protein
MARPTPSRPDLRRPAPRPRKWADVALRVAVVTAILAPPVRFLLAWLQ